MSVKKDEPIRSVDGYATNLLTVSLICVFIYIYTIESVERKEEVHKTAVVRKVMPFQSQRRQKNNQTGEKKKYKQ